MQILLNNFLKIITIYVNFFYYLCIMIEILKNIEAIRKEKHVKQELIAKELGVTQPAYSNYVTRNVDIPFSRLSQIADILKVDVVDIIKYPEHYIPESSNTPECEDCKEKDAIIRSLNRYIVILEGKVNVVPKLRR